jgi:hypothetical protein
MLYAILEHCIRVPLIIKVKKKVKISLLQAVEAPRVARGQGSHVT